MSNVLMIIGLLGMVAGVMAPMFRVLNKKPKSSGRAVILVFVSLLIFVAGVFMGL